MSRPDTSSEEYRTSLKNSLRWDSERDEPYLQLPSFSELRITPARQGDGEDITTLFNHPSIGERLYRLPYPLPRSFADGMVAEDTVDDRKLISQMESHLPPHAVSKSPSTSTSNAPLHPESFPNTKPNTDPTSPQIAGCPLRNLRDPSGRILGNISLRPSSFHFEEEDKAPTAEEHLAWPKERQVWDLGYVLEPSQAGRGVMSEMVGCLIEAWAVEWMGIGTVGAFAEFDNHGSVKVLNKNGLTLISRHVTDWPEEKGGGVRHTGRFERRLVKAP